MNTQLWLCLSVTCAGLWSGLLLTITTILHPMFARRDLPGFRADLGRFLPIARRSPTNYVLVIGLVAAPLMALVSLRHDRGAASFVLTAVGLGLTVVGAFGLSRFAAEPNYDRILSWDEATSPEAMRRARHRYFALNWWRGAFTWSALGCFLAATYLDWS